jgi:hypothetical protein
MKEWFKRVFNRNVYLTFDIPASSGDLQYWPMPRYKKSIIEIVYTGVICHSNDEAVLNLFMLSKHDGKRGWRFPTMHEAIYCSQLSVVRHYSNWNANRLPLELVIVRDVTEEEYNYYNGPITRFIKLFAVWTYS